MTPAPNRDRWAEWKELALHARESAARGLADWWQAVRKEPALIWQTPAVRYVAYGIGSIMLIVTLRTTITMLTPPAPVDAMPRATTANFDVICANPACGRHFVIERRFRFDDFPVACPYCKQETGRQALRCSSPQCGGRLVLTADQDRRIHCSRCGRELGVR